MKKKIKEDKRRKQGKSRHIILFYLFSILLLSILLVCGFFRFRFYVVLSGSMEPKLPVGSLVVADTERTNVKNWRNCYVSEKWKDSYASCHGVEGTWVSDERRCQSGSGL